MPVCIAGMHRSGTSMVAQLLHCCGLDLGDMHDLLPPASYNTGGFWEHTMFIKINETILQELQAAWDLPPTFSSKDLDRPALVAIQSHARALCQQFPADKIWGWKDPRNSITLPFWRALLPRLKVVICVRNPLEVVLSLRRRGYRSISRAFELWELYNRRALEAVLPHERILTHYDAYFARPAAELQRLVRFLGIQASDEVIARCASPTRSLRHGWLTGKHLQDVGVHQDLVELYYKLCAEAEWEDSRVEHRTPAPVNVDPTRPDLLNDAPSTTVEAAAASPQEASPPIEAELLKRELEMEKLRDARQEGERRIRELTSRLAQRDVELTRTRQQLETTERELTGLRQERATLERELEDRKANRSRFEELLETLRKELAHRHKEMRRLLCDLRGSQVPASSTREGEQPFDYRRLVRRIRAAVGNHVPSDSIVLMISKGDDALLDLNGHRGWHFPQDENGVYAGFHPADSTAAIAHLESMRAKGAEFLVIPATAYWWLEHYSHFRGYLERTFRLLGCPKDTCWIFSLCEPSPWMPIAELIADFRARCGRYPAILNWQSGVNLDNAFPECAVFAPLDPDGDSLPYIAQSIDIVALSSAATQRVDEARRLATGAVVILAPAGTDTCARVVTIEHAHVTTDGSEQGVNGDIALRHHGRFQARQLPPR